MVHAHRIYEIAGIGAFAAVEVALGWRIGHAVASPWQCALVVAGCLAGYLAADFTSGFIHWLFDRYGTTATPLFGANFVRPFREHHTDPLGITRHDFIETNGNNSIATAVPLLPALLWPLPSGHTTALFVVTLLGATGLAVFGTNQFHKWAHTATPPPWVTRLQRAGLILAPAHHAIHHAPPYDRYYCITTGWLNPLLFRVRFFPRLERLIFALSGIRAGEDDARQHHLAAGDPQPRP